MADLPAESFGISAGAGPVSGRNSHLSVFADRWRGGGSHGAAEDSAGLAIYSDGQCWDSHGAGGDGIEARVADFMSLGGFWAGAGAAERHKIGHTCLNPV